MTEICKEQMKANPRCGLECWSFDSLGKQYFNYDECGSEYKVLEGQELPQ